MSRQARMAAGEWKRQAMLEWDEATFLAEVTMAALNRGWLVYHPRPARTASGWRTAGSGTPSGFPDVVAARGGVVLLRELKREGGKPTQAQKRWLAECGGKIWRPSDWDEILEELA